MAVIFCAQSEDVVKQCEDIFAEAGKAIDIRMVDTAEGVLAWLCRFPIYANKALFPAPSLIVTDLQTPKGSGLDMIRWVRHHPQYMGLPLIVFGERTPLELANAVNVGANVCLPADAGSKLLCETIDRLLVR